ncbi:MAG: hypothetical protein ABIQ65_09170, partial [Thermoanaerobaculia bacterium]
MPPREHPDQMVLPFALGAGALSFVGGVAATLAVSWSEIDSAAGFLASSPVRHGLTVAMVLAIVVGSATAFLTLRPMGRMTRAL